MSKPVGVAQEGGRLIVVCDDGSVYRCEDAFACSPESAAWTLMPAVPNTDTHERLERAQRQGGGGMQWMGPEAKEEAAGKPAAEALPLRESA